MNPKRWAFLISVISVITLFFAANEIHKTVAIVINDEVNTTTLWGFTVADALKSADISLYEGDKVTPDLYQPINENQVILIDRAAWVIILKDNDVHQLWTVERDPSTLLAAFGISLRQEDRVSLNGTLIDLDEKLPPESIYTLKLEPSTPVEIKVGDDRDKFQSSKRTLIDALWEAGYQLYTADKLSPDPLTPLTGLEINASLERSTEITITSGDFSLHTRVSGETVGEALREGGYSIQGMSYSIPAEDMSIPSNGQIQIVQVREEFILEEESIPFSIEYVPSPEVDLDSQQILQTGEYGIQAKRVRVVYEDDKEISRAVSETWTAKTPKPRLVGYGTRANIQTLNTADGPIQYYRAVEAYATSYSPCRLGVEGLCSNRTASGVELKKGVIGVIRPWYNYMKGGSVYIPGYGFATIEDIGAGFTDRHWVDLGYSDQDWVSWSRYVKVYFLLPVPANILYILN